mgnify:CR=1 FL=1
MLDDLVIARAENKFQQDHPVSPEKVIDEIKKGGRIRFLLIAANALDQGKRPILAAATAVHNASASAVRGRQIRASPREAGDDIAEAGTKYLSAVPCKTWATRRR